jgi:hypothetical protein
VELARGIRLFPALRSLRESTGGLILTQLPNPELKLAAPIKGQRLSAALPDITRSFHLHAIRRGNNLVFIRRLWRPNERLDLEMEEIVATAERMERVTAAACPYPVNTLLGLNDKLEMQQGLTPEQLHAMQNGGLPFAGLTGAQQERWGRMTAMHFFRSVTSNSQRAGEMFRNWRRSSVSLHVLPPLPDGEVRTHVMLGFPDRYSDEGYTNLDLGPPRIESSQPPPEPQPSVETIQAPPITLPDRFQNRVQLNAGEVAVRELIRALEEASGVRIGYPSFAKDRRLLALVDGAPAADVIVALEDCYGWRLRPWKERGGYRLDRPEFVKPRNPVELHRSFREALPPVLRAQLGLDLNTGNARWTRQRAGIAEMLAQVNKKRGERWTSAPISDLDEVYSTRFANVALLHQLIDDSTFVRMVWKDEPSPFLTMPAAGVFTLSGPIAPGKRPALLYHLRLPGSNKDLAWGWIVGSSSVEQEAEQRAREGK